MARRPIAKPYTGDQQADDFGRDTSQAIEDIYNLLDPEVQARTMPFDVHTKAFWPCSEGGDPNLIGANIIGESFGKYPLNMNTSGVIHTPEGWTHRGSVRGYSAVASTNRYAYTNVAGAFGSEITGSNQLTVSCWFKAGFVDPSAATEKYIMNYQEQAGIFNAYTYILCYSQIGGNRMGPRFYLNRAAGIVSPVGLEDMQMAPGVWYFMWGQYNGTDVTVGLNTTATSTSLGVASPINWTPMANMRAFLGLSAASSFLGQVQDMRVDTVCRPASWINEAWERGMSRYGQDTSYKV